MTQCPICKKAHEGSCPSIPDVLEQHAFHAFHYSDVAGEACRRGAQELRDLQAFKNSIDEITRPDDTCSDEEWISWLALQIVSLEKDLKDLRGKLPLDIIVENARLKAELSRMRDKLNAVPDPWKDEPDIYTNQDGSPVSTNNTGPTSYTVTQHPTR